MTLVFGLEGHKGCKVAANIIHGFDCIFFWEKEEVCFNHLPDISRHDDVGETEFADLDHVLELISTKLARFSHQKL